MAYISDLLYQHARPSRPRKDLYALPGSARNFWWSSSKTPAVPKNESEIASQDATVADSVVPDQPPAEVATMWPAAVVQAARIKGDLSFRRLAKFWKAWWWVWAKDRGAMGVVKMLELG